jgi:hypothetical protein
LISLFSVASSKSLPFRATFAVYAETTGGRGTGPLTLRIVSPSGEQVYEISVNFDFDEPGDDAHGIIRLNGFEFSELGTYGLQLCAANETLMEMPISVELSE